MYTENRVIPKLVSDDSLKRARVENSDGTCAIRIVGSGGGEGGEPDLSVIETNTTDIKTIDNQIKNAVGTSSDTTSDSTVIGLLKSINTTGGGPSLTPITDALGTTSDTLTDNTVVGLLKNNKVELGSIRSFDNDIKNTIGTTNDSASSTTVIGQLKTIAQGTDYLNGVSAFTRDTRDAVGSTSDTLSQNTVIGLLKRMNSRF